jgi:hypothetical protein
MAATSAVAVSKDTAVTDEEEEPRVLSTTVVQVLYSRGAYAPPALRNNVGEINAQVRRGEREAAGAVCKGM